MFTFTELVSFGGGLGEFGWGLRVVFMNTIIDAWAATSSAADSIKGFVGSIEVDTVVRSAAAYLNVRNSWYFDILS